MLARIGSDGHGQEHRVWNLPPGKSQVTIVFVQMSVRPSVKYVDDSKKHVSTALTKCLDPLMTFEKPEVKL